MKNKSKIKVLSFTILFFYLSSTSLFCLESPHGDLNGISCFTCHSITKQDGRLKITVARSPAEQDAQCRSCHYPLGQASAMYRVGNHLLNSGSEVIQCGTCHNPHTYEMSTDNHTLATAENRKLVRSTISKLRVPGVLNPVVFHQASKMAFEEGNQPYNGVCQACHTQTLNHRNSEGSDHNHRTNFVCSGCHRHELGFPPVSYDHDPVPVFCNECHAPNRPADPHPQGGDCAECHSAGAGITWLGAVYDHTPLPGSCGLCHEDSRPVDPHPQTLDCNACHSDPGGSWLGATASHDPPPTSCAQCHEDQRPADPHPATGDCVDCHTVNIGINWQGATFTHSPVPSSCGYCHEDQRPADPHPLTGDCANCHTANIGVNWQGAIYTHTPPPMSCGFCHDDERPADPHPATGECIDCHADPGGVWQGATYNHSPVPASCSACHEDTRPADPHPATGDCAGCHTANIGSSWLGANYDHDPIPTSCTLCHEDDRPSAPHIQTNDCTLCHAPGSSWQGASGCVYCHDQTQGARRQIVGPGGDFDQSSAHVSGTVQDSDCLRCHDMSLHQQGTVILADPDNGGAWSGTGTGFCLTCHDGSPPAGVSFPASSGTGYDKSYYIGTTHDQSGGTDSCRECHFSHGSSFSALLKSRYIMNDYNRSSSGDGDYALCWNCHSESSVVSSNNAFGSLHQKHVRSEDASCITCHDAHGAYDAGEPGLISFDYPIRSGFDMDWTYGSNNSTAFTYSSGRGSCLLYCHGDNHNPETYGGGGHH